MNFLKVQIEGRTPLLIDRFTVQTVVQKNTRKVTLADNRPLRDQAEEKLYKASSGAIVFPANNLYRCFIEAGRNIKVGRRAMTNGRGSMIASGMSIEEFELPLKHHMPWSVDVMSCPTIAGRVAKVRPRFDEWGLEFTLSYDDRLLEESAVRTVVDEAGTSIGIGSFRPARSGSYGKFIVVSWKAVTLQG